MVQNKEIGGEGTNRVIKVVEKNKIKINALKKEKRYREVTRKLRKNIEGNERTTMTSGIS